MQVILGGDMVDTSRYWSLKAKLFMLTCGLLLCTSQAMATGGVTVTAATGGTAISANTTGGTYTALTGPTITENNPAGIQAAGTIILSAPSGFIFDTASNVTATVSSCGSGGGLNMLLGNSPGSSSQTVTPTASTITINVIQISSGSRSCTLTWSNIHVRPTSGTPLASGNITRSGTATMTEIPATTNYGSLTEVAGVVGAANKLAYGVQPSNTAAGSSISPAVTVIVQDQFGNTVTSNISSITLAIGTNPGSGTLSGVTSVTAVAGVATFSTLSINNVGTGYTLAASAAGLTGVTSGAFNITEPVSGFDAVEMGAARATNLYTKLASTAFSVDILALDSANNISTAYAGNVTVKLVDAATGGGVCGNMAVLQDYGSFSAFASGRKTVTLTYANAARNARIRINDASAGRTSCSTDNFSIRPTGITSVTSSMINTATNGTPSAIAGSGGFDLTVATGLSGYDGTPKIDNTAMQAHAGAKQKGVVSGTFPAAAGGTATGTGFTYSEVGNFRFLGYDPASDATTARGVYDDTFTSVDSLADCTTGFSNTLSGGKFGCKFGITANSSYFGRFYPKDFLLTLGALTNRQAASCSPASSFSYAGEQFRVAFTLTARNGASIPAITQNYDPAASFAPFNGATIANFGFGAIDLADATAPNTAAALTSSLTLGTSSGTWASGVGVFTADLMLAHAALPGGPFESFQLGIDPVDSDGVKLNSYNLDTTVPADTSDHGLVGTTKIRFGRLQIQNAYGSELLALPMSLTAEYWNGTSWVTNTADSCTVLTVPTSGSGLDLTHLANGGTTTATLNTLLSGNAGLSLSAPGAAHTGYVDIVISSPAWLDFNWKGAGATDPSARATFGIYTGSSKFIYTREIY